MAADPLGDAKVGKTSGAIIQIEGYRFVEMPNLNGDGNFTSTQQMTWRVVLP
jgi:hypothetical protein